MRVAERAWDELRNARQRSVAGVIEGAAGELAQEPHEVLEHVRNVDGGVELLNDAMLAAADTLNQEKVRALARALANGLRDDGARIDESRLIVQALTQLEEPHLRVLTIVDPAPEWTDFRAICSQVEHSLAVLPILERLGLIENNDDDYLQVVGEFYAEYSKYELAKEVSERFGSAEWEGAPAEPSDDKMTNFPTGYQRTPFGNRCLAFLENNPGSEHAYRGPGPDADPSR